MHKKTKKTLACCIPAILLGVASAPPAAAGGGAPTGRSSGSSTASRRSFAHEIEDPAAVFRNSVDVPGQRGRGNNVNVVEAPDDWKPLIDASQMLFSGTVQFTQGLQLWPNIGNGYVGGVLGCFPTDIGSSGQPLEPSFMNRDGVNEAFETRHNLGNDDPVATAGVVHVGGVFNGKGVVSTRAEVPGIHSVYPIAASLSTSGAAHDGLDLGDAPSISFAGAAIDFARGTFFNRTTLHGCGDAILEQRWYAHQQNRSLLVYEMEIISVPSESVVVADKATSSNCTVQLQS